MTTSGVLWIRVGALLMAAAVAAGAFGAHALRAKVESKLMAPRGLEVFETAVRYQMVHALGLIAVGLIALHGRPGPAATVAGVLFVTGIVLFCGSLYGLALEVGPRRLLGPMTPLGGVAFIAGWVSLALAAGSARAGTTLIP